MVSLTVDEHLTLRDFYVPDTINHRYDHIWYVKKSPIWNRLSNSHAAASIWLFVISFAEQCSPSGSSHF